MFTLKPMISGKKIFYVPGLISALLIPVLFWYFGNRKLNEPIPNVMDFGLPAKLTKENHNDYFEAFRNWNYQKISFSQILRKSNSAFYVQSLRNFKREMRKKPASSLF